MPLVYKAIDARHKIGFREITMPSEAKDRADIRALIENWALWRDARLWDRFRTVWHKDGQMWATWFQGSYEEFIKVSRSYMDCGADWRTTPDGMHFQISNI